METTIGVSRKTKERIEEIMKRHNLASLHWTIKHLIELEKEHELNQIARPLSKVDVEEVVEKVLRKFSNI